MLVLAPLGNDAWAQSRGLFPSHGGSPLGDFFSALFGGRPSYRPVEQPRIIVTPRIIYGSPSYSGGGHGYCVRTCDGRYFPLPGRAGAEKSDLAQCAAFCPAANMTVVSTSDPARGIDGAVTRDGKPYSELPNAYVFRQRLVEGCTCNGKVGGLTHVDVMADPTLKRGDVVMTSEGSRVFTGKTKAPPYRAADFVEPSRFPELPRSMRARLDELTVASR
ncbi:MULTISPECIES: DUF2865 domain-containing protein [Xanthobacter]|uniref:DUF2865 domain-containing protein n=1 Tax=Xanthobacter TaxID=279 RepID=UPI001AE44B42|nr:DUF2865 domain-containing protein [Xanthobacter flavus]MBP2151511.1 hypothetical protein [Xanthobacter flavus]